MTLPHALAVAAVVLIGCSGPPFDTDPEAGDPSKPRQLAQRPTFPPAPHLQCRRYFGCLPAERPLTPSAKE